MDPACWCAKLINMNDTQGKGELNIVWFYNVKLSHWQTEYSMIVLHVSVKVPASDGPFVSNQALSGLVMDRL